MSHKFDPDALLAALPRRQIKPISSEVLLPRARAVGDCPDHNGFTGKERLRTANVSKWLTSLGAIERTYICGLCGRGAAHEHAEDYYDLRSWIELCQGCHVNRLHQRFNRPNAWLAFLDDKLIPAGHWARELSMTRFDLAGLVRSRGSGEPKYESFAAKGLEKVDAGSSPA